MCYCTPNASTMKILNLMLKHCLRPIQKVAALALRIHSTFYPPPPRKIITHSSALHEASNNYDRDDEPKRKPTHSHQQFFLFTKNKQAERFVCHFFPLTATIAQAYCRCIVLFFQSEQEKTSHNTNTSFLAIPSKNSSLSPADRGENIVKLLLHGTWGLQLVIVRSAGAKNTATTKNSKKNMVHTIANK